MSNEHRISRSSLETSCTIANGQTASGAVRNPGWASGGFAIPAAFTGGSVSFQVSLDGSTFVALYHEGGAAISITVATSKAYPLPPEVLAFPYFKLVSAGAEGGDRTIGLSLRG